MVQPGNWFSWVEFAAEFQRISSLTRATAEPSPAGAVRLEADAQRLGEMDPESDSQQEPAGRTHRPHLPPTLTLSVMSLGLLHPMPLGVRGGRMGREKKTKGTVLNRKKPTSFQLAISLPASVLLPSKML